MIGKDFFVSQTNLSNVSKKDIDASASSINQESFSNIVNTTSAMLKSAAYSTFTLIDKSFGKWNYDLPKCTGTLNHSGRHAGCVGQVGNDDYSTADRFNIAIGQEAIVPYYLNSGYELCYSNKGWCNFEFYLK